MRLFNFCAISYAYPLSPSQCIVSAFEWKCLWKRNLVVLEISWLLTHRWDKGSDIEASVVWFTKKKETVLKSQSSWGEKNRVSSGIWYFKSMTDQIARQSVHCSDRQQHYVETNGSLIHLNGTTDSTWCDVTQLWCCYPLGTLGTSTWLVRREQFFHC